MQKINRVEIKETFPIISKNDDLLKFKALLEQLSEQYTKIYDEVRQAKDRDSIPACVFNRKLSPLETVVKYLKENLGFSLPRIATVLGRDIRTVWQAYKASQKKQGLMLKEANPEFLIPLEVLRNRDFSILESVSAYLKENFRLNFHQIGSILDRDERTIWTVYNRLKEKRR